MAFIENHPPGRALDLGCGTGTNVITLAQNGWQAYGIDFVPKAIRRAKAKAQQAGVEAAFKVGDVSAPGNFDGPFDLVLDIGCYHVLTDRQRGAYRKNLEKLLAPGGTYMLYTFTSLDGQQNSSVVSDGDIEAITRIVPLLRRVDGDDRGVRPSAWFWFVNQ
jgi:cyclopropane fatty-acyl-phospholipid synthase-like methyltransferase